MIKRIDGNGFIRQVALGSLILLVVLLVAYGYQGLPFIYREFVRICKDNTQKIADYNRCMFPYTNEVNWLRTGLALSTLSLVISAAVLAVQKVAKPGQGRNPS